MVSVIIPAHNEAAVIARCLSGIVDETTIDDIEVIVVCNGCTDETEDVARSFAPAVHVVTIPVASKSVALNIGDSEASGNPRFYVDADVEVSATTLRTVGAVLAAGPILAASPGLRVDTSLSSAPVRAYYRLWTRLPSVRDDIAGRGVYGLSLAGRQRFDRFPDAIADDAFVRNLFTPGERLSVDSCYSLVTASRTLAPLVRRKARVIFGNRQLRSAGKGEHRSRRSRVRSWSVALRSDPQAPADLLVYLYVTALGQVWARWKSWRRQEPDWGRDDSRAGAGSSEAR